jgi:hypothetical protein
LAYLSDRITDDLFEESERKKADIEADIAMAREKLHEIEGTIEQIVEDELAFSIQRGDVIEARDSYALNRENEGEPIDVRAYRTMTGEIEELDTLIARAQSKFNDNETMKLVLEARLAGFERARESAKINILNAETAYEKQLLKALSFNAIYDKTSGMDPDLEAEIFKQISSLKETVGASVGDEPSIGNPVIGAEGIDLNTSPEGRALQAINDVAQGQCDSGTPPNIDVDMMMGIMNNLSNSLMNMNLKVRKDNSLIREMKLLNLASLAGFDPYVVTQVFGVTISGVAKRLLDAWVDNGRAPLMFEDIRKVFKLSGYHPDTHLDIMSVSEGLNKALMKDMRPKPKGSKGKGGDKPPTGETKTLVPNVGVGGPPEPDERDDDELSDTPSFPDDVMEDLFDDGADFNED